MTKETLELFESRVSRLHESQPNRRLGQGQTHAVFVASFRSAYWSAARTSAPDALAVDAHLFAVNSTRRFQPPNHDLLPWGDHDYRLIIAKALVDRYLERVERWAETPANGVRPASIDDISLSAVTGLHRRKFVTVPSSQERVLLAAKSRAGLGDPRDDSLTDGERVAAGLQSLYKVDWRAVHAALDPYSQAWLAEALRDKGLSDSALSHRGKLDPFVEFAKPGFTFDQLEGRRGVTRPDFTPDTFGASSHSSGSPVSRPRTEGRENPGRTLPEPRFD